MASGIRSPAHPPSDAPATASALHEARARTLALVAPLDEQQLTRAHSPLLSPLVWDLGHIAAYEDLWLAHRHAGLPLLHPELADLYDAFETPRAVRGELEMLGPRDAHRYLDCARARVEGAISHLGVGDGTVHEMVVRHEHQHNETMLQTFELGRLPLGPAHAPRPPDAPGPNAPALGSSDAGAGTMTSAQPPRFTGLEMVEVPGGPCALGAPPGRFSFDNERPLHPVSVRSFCIGRTAVTNATWLTFAEGGGYERREWWTDEGWAWKEEYDIGRPAGWATDLPEAQRPPGPPRGPGTLSYRGEPAYEWRCGAWEHLHPHRPVIHVSWFEADAFARAHGVRLPTEAEWEKAATWDQATGSSRPWPWGAQPPAGEHANLYENGRFGTAPVGAHPGGAAPCGALGMVGDTWEWTQSCFGGYPGFVAHPYREYSEVFFTGEYRVLRGGSWATARRVADATVRNWDLPGRRQIFSGVRVARSS